MLKLSTKDGRVIAFGFSEGNFRLLKEGKPIVIPYKDMKLPWVGGVVVAYPNEELQKLTSAIPQEWSLIKLNDEAMSKLRSGTFVEFDFTAEQVIGSQGGSVKLFWGKDEETMRDQVIQAGLIGPETEEKQSKIKDGQHKRYFSDN